MKLTKIDIDNPKNAKPELKINYQKKVFKFFEKYKFLIRRSFEYWQRIIHSNGNSAREVFTLLYGKLKRYFESILYPNLAK